MRPVRYPSGRRQPEHLPSWVRRRPVPRSQGMAGLACSWRRVQPSTTSAVSKSPTQQHRGWLRPTPFSREGAVSMSNEAKARIDGSLRSLVLGIVFIYMLPVHAAADQSENALSFAHHATRHLEGNNLDDRVAALAKALDL